ncbi:uncharacterized protein LOC127870331 [Dreissena polymorpha]|uniref:Uncharacterized protein n=1 Tax=Dreissena polymorpha TaxID=45954 RepID=A0A9D4M2Y2_DREPO|nr:uncharacterized protein LOC127870331 [Dreissena polymorpha]KAH3868626.1 hypothetical protein DPMN_031777 [Dreissena polymorpha]
MRRVSNIDQIGVGDVIVFTYWLIAHQGIVSGIVKKNEDEVYLQVIHYGTQSIFATRTIMEETLLFNLRTQTVYVMSFDGQAFESETIVKRARSRIGEKRHQIIHNKSLQFVEWAVVGTHVQWKRNTTHGPLHLYNVYSWEDLHKGSIVEFTYYGIDHQGILTECDEDQRKITVIHYGTRGYFSTRTIMEDTLDMDLKTQSLKIYRYDGGRRYNEPDLVVKKAKERVGERNWKAGNRSWDFCLQCLFFP